MLSLVEKDKNTKAAIVEIDSPGGSVTASDMIYNRLVKFRKDHPGMPVVSAMDRWRPAAPTRICGELHRRPADDDDRQHRRADASLRNLSDLMQKLRRRREHDHINELPLQERRSMFKPDDPVETKYFRS